MMDDDPLRGQSAIPRGPGPFDLAAYVGIGSVVGAFFGFAFGFVTCSASMLGDAEIYPPNAIPPAPDFIPWVFEDVGIGATAGMLIAMCA
jgi:hypothetical protein